MLDIPSLIKQVEPKIVAARQNLERIWRGCGTAVGEYVDVKSPVSADELTTLRASREWGAMVSRTHPLDRFELTPTGFRFMVG